MTASGNAVCRKLRICHILVHLGSLGKVLADNLPPSPRAANGLPIEVNLPTVLGWESFVDNQKRWKEWEYRAVAVNKAGEGKPSNA